MRIDGRHNTTLDLLMRIVPVQGGGHRQEAVPGVRAGDGERAGTLVDGRKEPR